MLEQVWAFARRCRAEGQELYLVGGYVRDLLAGVEAKDLDFVVPRGQGLNLARRLADELAASFVPLDEENDVGRVVAGELVIDLAARQGNSLIQDLRRRDFTINAMALPLTEAGHPAGTDQIIDPLGGLEHWRQRMLAPCHPRIFQDDPVRLLRALRLAARFGLTFAPELEEMLSREQTLLALAARERIGEEISQLFALPGTAAVITADLETRGLFYQVWPELEEMMTAEQNFHHTVTVGRHCLAVLEIMEEILAEPEQWLGAELAEVVKKRAVERLTRHPRQRYQVWKLGALFHDMGKPKTAMTRESGRIVFYGHEREGATLIGPLVRRLTWGRREAQLLQKLVALHMRPLHLFNTRPVKGKPSRRALYRFYRDVGEDLPDLLVLAVADLAAKVKYKPDKEEWETFQAFILGLWDTWLKEKERWQPEPMLRGDELAAAFPHIKGAEIGRMLRELLEAQALGQIQNRDQAWQLVKSLIQYT
ncbi:MAG: HD domain-containing protein [Bacillota bacterium]